VSKYSTAARWVVAVPAAIFAFSIGMVLMIFAYKPFGGNALTWDTWTIAVATILGGFVGTLIVPPRQRRTACYIFIGASCSFTIIVLLYSLFEHAFKWINIFDVLGSLIGGLIVWRGTKKLRML
jgi:hypothetical protein